MQVGAPGDHAEPVGRETHADAELDRDLGGALAVTVGVGVLHLDRAHQRAQRLGIALDDVVERIVGERRREHSVPGPR